jgi:hypothetical protein
VTFAQRIWWILGIAWLAVILDVTLRSAPDLTGRVAELPWYCIVCGEAGIADFILNLMLFAPLGVAAHALRLPRWRAMAFAVALTVAIETTQARFLVGRDGSLGDVLSNSGGAVLGWLAFPSLMHLGRPSRSFARAGVVGVLAFTAVIWFGTGIGLRPALSAATPWVGELQHEWPGYDPFPGKINAAEINGVQVPNDPFTAPKTLHDSIELRVMLTRTLPPPMRRTSVVRIVDANGSPQVSVTESGTELNAELELRASRWGLHTPEWLFPGVMVVPEGELWQLYVRWTPGRVSMTTADSSGARALVRSQLQSIALGWVFIHPFVLVVGSNATFWNCLWLGWWFALLGWLGGALSWRATGVAAAVQLATLIVAATLTGATWHAGELLVALAVSGLTAAAARFRAGASPPPQRPINSG